MKCIHCDGALVSATKDDDLLEIDGHQFVATVPVRRCSKCGEEFFDGTALERLELLAARKLADSGVRSGETVRFMRKALGLSGIEVADLLDVVPETISRWETGKRDVDRSAFAVLGALVADAIEGRTDMLDRLWTLRDPKPLGERVVL